MCSLWAPQIYRRHEGQSACIQNNKNCKSSVSALCCSVMHLGYKFPNASTSGTLVRRTPPRKHIRHPHASTSGTLMFQTQQHLTVTWHHASSFSRSLSPSLCLSFALSLILSFSLSFFLLLSPSLSLSRSLTKTHLALNGCSRFNNAAPSPHQFSLSLFLYKSTPGAMSMF